MLIGDRRGKFVVSVWCYRCFRIRDKNYNLLLGPCLEKKLVNEVALFLLRVAFGIWFLLYKCQLGGGGGLGGVYFH